MWQREGIRRKVLSEKQNHTWSLRLKFRRPALSRTTLRGMVILAVAMQRMMSRAEGGA